MISTVRLADSRLLKPSGQRYPYATGFGSKSMHALDHQSPETSKSGYLMVLDKRKGRSNLSWTLEHCIITPDAMLASITSNARQPRPFLHLAACSFRMINGNKHTGRGFAKKNIVEVVDRDTNMPLVYLQARTKEETRAWLFELRVRTAYNQQQDNGVAHQDSYCSTSLGLDNRNEHGSQFSFVGWGENNQAANIDETENGRGGGGDECLGCCTHGSTAALHGDDNPQYRPKHRMDNNSAPMAADPAAVSVISAGVLYLQTHMEDEPKPVPHYLHTRGSTRWRPFIGVLATCSDSVGFFLLDANDSRTTAAQQQQQQQQQQQVRVVAELDVRLLSTHDIQPLDDSLFGSSFAFSIRARQSSSAEPASHYSTALAEQFGPEMVAKLGRDEDASNDSISVLTRSTTTSKTDTGDSVGDNRSKPSTSIEDVESVRPMTSGPVSDPEPFGGAAKWTVAEGIIGKKERSRSLGDLIDFGTAVDTASGLDQIAELDEVSETSEQQQSGGGSSWSELGPKHRVHGGQALPSVLYLSTMRATERSSWVHHLRRFTRSPMLTKPVGSSTKPQSVVYRIERSLWVGVCEVRGLVQQEPDGEPKAMGAAVSAMLSLDGSPIACCEVPRVQANGSRREAPTHQFLFGSLPPVCDGMSIVVRSAGDAKRGETAATGGGLLGYCHIPVPFMRQESTYDGWYPLSYGPVGAIDRRLRPYVGLASNVKPTSELLCTVNRQSHDPNKQAMEPTAPSMPFRSGDARIQVRYDELVVLGRPLYSGVLEHLFDTNPTIVFDLAAGLPRSADWLVETLAKIALATGKFERWIEALVKHELQVQSVRDPALIFRGASVTTRAMDTLMKVSGLSFLDQMIGEIVRAVTDSEHKCEVDPAKLAEDESVDDHWEMLTQLLQALWRAIEDSRHLCPVEMRRAFYRIRLAIGRYYAEDKAAAVDKGALGNVRYSCVSGFMFLRLLCPAMLSPRSFGLVSQAPSVSSLRTLTLLAKGIQCTANLTDFAQKEPYMQPMNAVIQQSIPKMKSFIDYIASGDTPPPLPLQRNGGDSAAISAVVDGERELAALCVFVSGAQDELSDLVALATAAYSVMPYPNMQRPVGLDAVHRKGSISGPCSPTTAAHHDSATGSPETPGTAVASDSAPNGSAGETPAGNGGSVRGQSGQQQPSNRPLRKTSDGQTPMRRKTSHLMMLDLSYQIPSISLPTMNKRESTRHQQSQQNMLPPIRFEPPALRESSLNSVNELLRLCQVVQELSNFCKQKATNI
ncbi:GTPase activating factor [Coemansia sp. RSA 1933]|nr:GTPase activating factor [Coemansia sp. RSA 1933]